MAAGASHLTVYTYDGFDRPAVTAFADGTSDRNTSYDADGNVLARLNRSGQAFTMAYDALDRLTSKLVPAAGSIPANTISTSYDLLGHVIGVSDTNGNTLADVYDRAGRMTSAARTTPFLSSKTVSYQYDQASNRTRLTWPDGYYAAYAYDALNHPTTVADSIGTTLATYAYDSLGRRSSLHYNGTSGAAMSYAWSPEDDLVTLSSDFAGSSNDVSFTNDFTPAHQWNSSTISNAAFRFAPPATTSASYGTVNGVNQYPNVAGSTWTYDTRGNLTGITAAAPAVMAYDAENRMMADSAANATYAYDPDGRRTAKTITTTGSGPLWGTAVWGAFTWTAAPTTTTSFLHDGDSEIAEYDNTGALIRRFVPGPAIDEYIAMVTGAGATTYVHTDKMGSVIAMSDASGNLAEGPYTYDGYGNCMVGGAYCTAGGEPFRFTGQRLDPETALYYYRARYYASAYGRFNQTDAVGYKDDLNLYSYVGNDPTDRTDPTGLMCVGSGKDSRCTIDFFNGAKVTNAIRAAHPGIAALETKLTAGYKDMQAAAARGQIVRIAGNAKLGIKPVDIPAARLLQRSQMDTLDLLSRKITRTAYGETWEPTAETDSAQMVTTFYRSALTIPAERMRNDFKHEILHLDPATMGWQFRPLEHQKPFDDAAESIH